MMALSNHGAHSAQVNMQLLVGGKSIRVNQMGPDFLFLDTPVDLPPTMASLVLQVDDSKRRWDVYLPDGISAAFTRVTIAPAPSTD